MIVSDGSGTFSHFSRVAGGCDSLGEPVVVVLFSAGASRLQIPSLPCWCCWSDV